jgi:hypothetical protein
VFLASLSSERLFVALQHLQSKLHQEEQWFATLDSTGELTPVVDNKSFVDRLEHFPEKLPI